MTKSHVPAMNAPTKTNVRVGRRQNTTAKESATCQKRGRPIGSKDLALRKRRNKQSSSYPLEEARNAPEEVTPEEAYNAPEEVIVKFVLFKIMEVPEEALVLDNKEISILYNYSRKMK